MSKRDLLRQRNQQNEKEETVQPQPTEPKTTIIDTLSQNFENKVDDTSVIDYIDKKLESIKDETAITNDLLRQTYYLTYKQVAIIDAIVKKGAATKSEIIRKWIDDGIKNDYPDIMDDKNIMDAIDAITKSTVSRANARRKTKTRNNAKITAQILEDIKNKGH